MDPTQCVAGNYLMKSLFIQTISLFVITGYPQIDKIPCVYTVSDQLAYAFTWQKFRICKFVSFNLMKNK